MKHKYRIRKNSGSDKNKLPLYAEDADVAVRMAVDLATKWETTIIVERYSSNNQWYLIKTCRQGVLL